MKKTLLFLTVATLMTSGCSKTWSGIKQDSNELFVDTKEAIHEATAPSVQTQAPIVHNQVSNTWDEQSSSAANRVVKPAETMASSTTSTVTPMTDASKVQVFEDTPTATSTK